MTTQLIKVRGDMDREFAKAKYKFRLWEKVASKLNESLVNVKVTAKDCDDKWRNIVATYRKNIDKMKSFGDCSVRWEYFTAMDNILQGTREFTDYSDGIASDDPISRLVGCFGQTEVVVKSEPIDVVDFRYTSSFDSAAYNDFLAPLTNMIYILIFCKTLTRIIF